MQNQKTEKKEIDPNVLGELTEQDLMFYHLVRKDMGQLEAYKEAFNVHHWKDNSIRVEASRLWTSPKLSLLRVLEAESAVKIQNRTLEERVARMERLSVIAEQSGNMGAAVAAEEKAGKLEGKYIEKSEHTHIKADMTAEALLQRINEEYGRDTVIQVAARKGIHQDIVDKVLQVVH